MNAKKQRKLLESQERNAIGIFECIPKTDHWSITQVIHEINRIHPSYTVNMPVLQGCLKSLEQCGLIRCDSDGLYFQTEVREPQPKKPTLTSVPKPIKEKPMPAPKKQDPLAVLEDISKDITNLKEKMDAAAIAIQDQFEAIQEQGKKWRAMKAMMQGDD